MWCFNLLIPTCIFFLTVPPPAKAGTTLSELFNHQIQKSIRRAEVIEEASEWTPARLGASIT